MKITFSVNNYSEYEFERGIYLYFDSNNDEENKNSVFVLKLKNLNLEELDNIIKQLKQVKKEIKENYNEII